MKSLPVNGPEWKRPVQQMSCTAHNHLRAQVPLSYWQATHRWIASFTWLKLSHHHVCFPAGNTFKEIMKKVCQSFWCAGVELAHITSRQILLGSSLGHPHDRMKKPGLDYIGWWNNTWTERTNNTENMTLGTANTNNQTYE